MSQEHLDVLIVGAGISGIGSAYHLQQQCPTKRYAIVEGRASIGGTWDLFRYPGIRSDSDMFTLGFSFHPWKEAKAIADGPSILRYLKETAQAYGIDRHIRYQHRVIAANWDSAQARWIVDIERGPERKKTRLSCSFLHSCSGYYRYDQGYTPDFPGVDRFRGRLIHPQQWPEDLDYAGKKVVVIGSGATAVTLVPSMADTAAHVTMLQRSPSYVLSLPAEDPIANLLRRHLPEKIAHSAARWKNVMLSMLIYQVCRRRPEYAKRLIRKYTARALPPGYPVDTHFRPTYNPWEQRLCLIPNSDLFKAIRKGGASIETGHIESFTETGIQLRSGRHLDADIIISATGLQLVAMGGVRISVDGSPVDLSKRFSYKGVMLSGVPNAATSIGYVNASWTLRADLISRYVCRLINHMDRHGHQVVTAVNTEPSMPEMPLLDLTSGYVQRANAIFPKQGPRKPWHLPQNYFLDLLSLSFGTLDDGALRYEGKPLASNRMRGAA